MFAQTLILLVLLKLLPLAISSPILEYKPLLGDDRFGKNIRLLYNYNNVTALNWIGIYPSGALTNVTTTDVLWSSLCGDQVSWNTTCDPTIEGDVRFRIAAPDQSSNGEFPLNPGDYKSCLMEDREEPYTEIECIDFNVFPFPDTVSHTSSVTPNKTIYEYDETIDAKFYATVPTVNAWIGLFPADQVGKKITELPSKPANWVYIGCNNQDGNQPVSKYCNIRKADSSVQLNSTKFTVSSDWPIKETGKYKLCLSYFNNPPYTEFACSDEIKFKGFEIKVSSSSLSFDSDIEVSYRNPILDEETWIGIFPSSLDPYKYYKYSSHWANTCGNQKYPCKEVKSGSVIFSGADPDQESREQWPISPGKKKACLIRFKEVILCDDFTISDIPSDVVGNTTLTTSKATYLDDEPIIANFTTPVGIQNTWVGLYKASGEVHQSKRGLWVYTACNNQAGDQTETNNCQATKTSGTIQIDETVEGGDMRRRTKTRALKKKGNDKYVVGSWPISADTYILCMHFYNNRPYLKYICSDEFEKKYIFNLTMPSDEIEFGSDIEVFYKNPIHDGETWIGIYPSSADVSDHDYLLHWSNTCGNQNKYCTEEGNGTVTFSGADPKQAYHEFWPISPGSKKVCLMRFDEAVLCKEFTIKDIPSDYLVSSGLTTAESYNRYDPIMANFSTPYGIPNTWIGLYEASDITATEALPYSKYVPLLWVYSGCNNQEGDQAETGNCQQIKATGSIQFDGSSKGNKKKKWPLPVNTYVLCMSIYSNMPYTEYFCGDSFEVV